MTLASADLRVFHIGGGSYACGDRTHSTYQIWKELAAGFDDYHVVGRSMRDSCSWTDENLRVDLIASRTLREWEFLATQFAALSRLNGAKPDVVVAQSPVSGGLAAIAVSRRYGSRTLMELHTDAFFTGARPGSNQWWYQKISAWALPRATLIRVLTPSMGQKVVDLYGSHLAPKIRVLPPRVNLRSFSPRRGTRRPGPLRIITVGSLVERKGQVRLINALADVNFPVDLHIVGDGPHMELCRSAQQALPPHVQVKLHGSLRHVQIAELLRAADVFVLYSNSEGTPRAIMEAMAAGLPVISTDVGFCSDMIDHGTDGYLLGPDPDADLIPLLRNLAEDQTMAENMGQAALARARRDYDSEKLYPAYRQLIAEAAAL
jgi:glycosyltransferase involved in cell wall biosynthesis